MEIKNEIIFNKLILKIHRRNNEIEVFWHGKSNERNPEEKITPFLNSIIKECGIFKKLLLNFSYLEYMNSSTVTPVIQFLTICQNENKTVSVIYNKNIKWQELSFSALEIFETKDRKIQIIGK